MAGGGTNTSPDRSEDARALLMLSRTRALAALQTACGPADRASLEHTIADLARRIAALTADR
jgi:hypothetical protein